jgi:hypothetical protein
MSAFVLSRTQIQNALRHRFRKKLLIFFWKSSAQPLIDTAAGGRRQMVQASRSSAEADQLIAEVNHVLSFSQIYLDAFKIKGNRIRLWRLLCILVDSTDEQLKVVNLREDERVLQLLGNPSPYKAPYQFKKLISALKNDQGNFYSLVVRGQKKDRAYVLNKNFDDSVIQYLRAFTREIIPAAGVLEHIDATQAREFFKIILNCIRVDHWNAWQDALRQIVSKTKLEDPDKWIHDVSQNSSYWVILLTAWKKHLGEHKILIDVDGYEREIFARIGKPKSRLEKPKSGVPKRKLGEVETILEDLSREDARILIKGISEIGEVYRLNVDMEPALASYCETLMKVRTKLASDVAPVIAGLRGG